MHAVARGVDTWCGVYVIPGNVWPSVDAWVEWNVSVIVTVTVIIASDLTRNAIV